MQAGTLKEVVTVRKQSWTVSEYGEQKTETWTDAFKCRAHVKRMSGGRENEVGELFFASNVVFSVRIYQDIGRLDRIVWNDDEYRILDIFNDKSVQRLVITTELVNK